MVYVIIVYTQYLQYVCYVKILHKPIISLSIGRISPDTLETGPWLVCLLSFVNLVSSV